MEKIILPLPLINWKTGRKALWKGGVQFQDRISFHPLFAIGNQLLVIQEWVASLEGAQLYISLCQWDWNPPTFLGLSQNCYKLCGGVILGICWGMSDVLCPWHTWEPRTSMWQSVTAHSRLGFLISLPRCTPLPGPGWQMVKDNVSTWESSTLRDWECVMESAISYRDLLKK